MTKLQIINTFLTERLMAALNEIMDMVGGTVLQYEKELDSVQKDNEYLRRRLKETENLIESSGPDVSNPAPESTSQQLKWTSSFETETMPTEIYQNQNQLFRVDHVVESSGKTRGSGTCFYINKSWCTDVTVLKKMRCPNLEALFINCKPSTCHGSFPHLFW
ncbi:uncharacterized protein LOC127450890 isoform X4 [Myxocyprinus asiaticus]|uniref:uncharacterized protein LOC127450890 isoform X4 n=1 Tax=Myxocyprinus asiaticus TaxID=70543 RepID=UPI00222398E5|nr:uncharacterized protein LOC127450890 isoform X4 [Myxocyprinus asiaticus]